MTAALPMHIERRKYLFFLLVVSVLTLVIVVLLKMPSSPIQKIYQKKPTVEIKSQYKNPFDKSTQYVNPFEKYKNPFVTNR